MRRHISSWTNTLTALGLKKCRSKRDSRRWGGFYSRVEKLEDRRVLSATADIVFLIDESGSTDNQNDWLADVVTKLDARLEAVGIANNRFGLVGFAESSNSEYAHTRVLDPLDTSNLLNPGGGGGDGDTFFGTAEQLAFSADNSFADGGTEDGWDAIEHAVAEYNYRPGAVVLFVLLQNGEGRSVAFGNDLNESLTRDGILAAVGSVDGLFNAVVSAPFDSAVGNPVLGVEADSADSAIDGEHIAHVHNVVVVDTVPPDALQVSHDGSNIGPTGLVASGKSVEIGLNVTPGIPPSAFGYAAAGVTYAFEDISSTGTQVLQGQLDATEELDVAELGGFAFQFYGEERDHLFFSTHGLITFESADSAYTNQDFIGTPVSQPVIAPFWDDSSPTASGSVYWQVKDVGLATERLILQWDDVSYIEDTNADEPITYQAILYADGLIRFNYDNIDSATAAPSHTGGISATVGVAAPGFDVTELVEEAVFIDGTHQINGGVGFDDEYVRLAWDTDGAAWNLYVVEQYLQGASEQPDDLEALNKAFLDSVAQQVLKRAVYGEVFQEGTPVVQLNVGGPTIGEYISDTAFAPAGTTTVTTTDVIDLSSNAVPNNATETIFRSGRKAASGQDMNWDFNEAVVPNGTYVVELAFTEIESSVTSGGQRQFDVVIEGATVLDNYDIYDDRAKITSTPNGEGELLVEPAGGVADATAPAAVVKRFRVEVTDSNGLQLDLLQEAGAPLLSGIRILGTPSADFDGDGDVDGADFLTWQQGFGSGTTRAEGDADFDNDVDGDDLAIWQLQYGNGSPIGSADFNCNGVVDGSDFLTWQRGFGQTNAYFWEGDADFDRDVDGDDLAIWQMQYGTSSALISGFDADFDDDEAITAADYMTLQQNLGMTSAEIADGDANADGVVDGLDILAYELEYDRAHPETNVLQSVAPVYAAMALQPGQILVSTLEDEVDGDYSLGDLSLREALVIAGQTSGADTIVFAVSGTIAINPALGQFSIATNVTIDGPGAGQLTISGADAKRVFSVSSGVTVTVQDVTIADGYVPVGQNGGGISNAGDLTLSSVTIVDNFAGSNGGGVYSGGAGSAIRIYNSTIANNQAGWGGGVRVALPGSTAAEIVGSTIHSNTANNGVGNGVAGGVYFTGGAGSPTALVANTTISGNTALQYSGGLRAHQSAVVNVTNSTITLNHADIVGGGFSSVGGSVTTFANTIVLGNTSGNANNTDGEGVFYGGTSTNLMGRIAGTTYYSGPSGLAPLADNGGPTLTHAISPTSPAFNAGNNTAAAALTTDQRGLSRLVGGVVDIGAFEYQAIVVSTLTDENDGNYAAGDVSLREAIALAGASLGADRIEFAAGLAGTITLASRLEIGAGFLGDLEIDGPGKDVLTVDVDGNDDYALLVAPGTGSTIASLVVRDLALTGADEAAVSVDATLAPIAVTLSGVRIHDNAGGGVSVDGAGSALTVTDSELSGNQGFALQLNQSSSLDIMGSSIVENDGVGIDLYGVFDASVINSTISGNQSAGSAGALKLTYAFATIVNSTIVDNVGVSTGGVYMSYGGIEARNSIIAGNYGSAGASEFAGQYYWGFDGSTQNLVGVDPTGQFPTADGNQVGVSLASLRLAPLANYGGPTRTHKLLAGSIAIDAGDDDLAVDDLYNPLAVDQRGRSRFVNTVDIGAVEQELLGDFNGDGAVSGSDFLLWQQTSGSTADLRADADGDGIVGGNDLSIWSDHFGNTPNGTPLSAEYGILAVSTLTDEADSDFRFGDLSLRETLNEAQSRSGDDMIVFRHDLGGTLALSGTLGQLTLGSNVEIVGPGADELTVSGSNATRVFSVSSGVTASISGLRIANGYTASMGGGVANYGALTLDKVAVESNVAPAGGGVYSENASLTVLNSTIADNQGYYVGGGLYLVGGANSLVNSTISSNTTTYGGGGVYSSGGATELRHSTVTANRASSTSGGGGLYVSSGQFILDHSIVANNFVGSGTAEHDIYGALDIALSQFNLLGTAGTGGLTSGVNGNLVGVADPGLTSLGFHGGRTRTHALLAGSLAIDAGDDTITVVPGTDQRGLERIDDGDGDSNDWIDIGAFELAADEYFGAL